MTVTIPKVCKAAVVQNPGADYTISLVEDYPVPTPTATQLLLKLEHTGLCMSDVHYMLQDWSKPMTCKCAGHEGSGTVVAMGSEVNTSEWKIGDRAGIKPLWDACRTCANCLAGNDSLCSEIQFSGQTIDGTFCEYVVSPARYTTKIPLDIPGPIAAVTMCSGSTIFAALKVSKAKPGEYVVIPGGGGGVGHQGILYGRALGFKVVAIDSGEDKRKMCLDLGAEAFVDFKTCDDVPAEVKRVTGGGAHAVIVTGGTASAYEGAPRLLRTGGYMVCVGLPPRGSVIAGADPLLVINLRMTMVGSAVATLEQVDEALGYCSKGLVKPHITLLPFKDFKKGWAMLVESKVAGRVVIEF